MIRKVQMAQENEQAKASATQLWLEKRTQFINLMKDQVLPLVQGMQEAFPQMCQEQVEMVNNFRKQIQQCDCDDTEQTAKAESLIKNQKELDAENLAGGVLGDRNPFYYVSLFADESLDQHLESRKSFWLRKKDLGENLMPNEVGTVRNLLNAVTTYVANMHEENLMSYYGE